MNMPSPRKPPHAIRPRVYLRDDVALGPGKMDLLKQVDARRSISAAARAMGMSYKRAWVLIASLNEAFGKPVVATSTGGHGGGGASLTPLGATLVDRYAALEARVNRAASRELEGLAALLPARRR